MNHFVNFILSCLLSLFIVESSLNTDNLKNGIKTTVKQVKVIDEKNSQTPVIIVENNTNKLLIEVLKSVIMVIGGCISTIALYLIDKKFKLKEKVKSFKKKNSL